MWHWDSILSVGGWLRVWQAEEKCAASAWRIGNSDSSAQGTDDFAGDGQPKAEMVFDAAGLVGTVEAPEYFLLLLVGDADAIVGNRQNEAFRLSGSIQRKG